MARMGYVFRALDKLPGWAKIILYIGAFAAMIYGLITEGPIYLLKVLIKPIP